jgi:hypothetical protein
MRSVALILLVCCVFSSSASAIECQSTPGSPKTGWWSWRDIEGRKCWFIKAGAMPPKSELHWPTNEKREVRSVETAPPVEATEQAPVSASQGDIKHPAPKGTLLPQFNTTRVTPVTATPLGLTDGQVDLLSGAPLSSMQVFGVARRRPANPDAFNARFTGKDH